MHFGCLCPLFFCLVGPALCQVVEGVVPEKCILVAHGLRLLWGIKNTHSCICMCTHTHKSVCRQMGCEVERVVLAKTASWEEMNSQLDFEWGKDVDWWGERIFLECFWFFKSMNEYPPLHAHSWGLGKREGSWMLGFCLTLVHSWVLHWKCEPFS